MIYLTPFGPAVPFVEFVIVSSAIALFAIGYVLGSMFGRPANRRRIY